MKNQMTPQVAKRIEDLDYKVESFFTKDERDFVLVLSQNESTWKTVKNADEVFARVVDITSTSNFPEMNVVIYDTKVKTLRFLQNYVDNFNFSFDNKTFNINAV